MLVTTSEQPCEEGRFQSRTEQPPSLGQECCAAAGWHITLSSSTHPAQVLCYIEEQSPDIGQSVHGMGTKALEEIGAGDQGHMFGYATDETPELMPLTHMIATNLGKRLTDVRKNGTCPWLRPDGKTQVCMSSSTCR